MAKDRLEYLLVDGYNVIFAWESLNELAQDSMEDARVKLMDILSDYQGFTGYGVIVVFDAHKVKDNAGLEMQYHNITAVFTKEFETADNYIERITNDLAKKHKVRVATSDNLEQVIIMGRGAYRISARELYYEIMTGKKQLRKEYIEKRPVKNNALIDNLDPKTASMLEKMRLEKGEGPFG